jgi:hypothetical protein
VSGDKNGGRAGELTEPPFLCGHAGPGRRLGSKLICAVCGSFWDLDSLRASYDYTNSYSAFRHHLEEETGLLKVRSFLRWSARFSLPLRSMSVCEVGFGGGHCLARLHAESAWAGGIEVIEANLKNARDLGIPADRLFDGTSLPESLPVPIDLWIFLDSFEHLPRPLAFLEWLAKNSAGGARALIVAPRADAPSERILGRLWPHRLPDHQFHWSSAGLAQAFASAGFQAEKHFAPAKFVSPKMILSHVAHKLGGPSAAGRIGRYLPSWALRFNVGEQGIVFRRGARPV